MTAVSFGRGARRELASAFESGTPVLVIATPGRLPVLRALLEDAPPSWEVVAEFTDIPQHVPRATLDAAAALVRQHGVRGVLAFGGGSPIGVAKALATQFDLRKVYVPTTFSGSEVTNIWAVSDHGEKTTARDERVRADLVIYDVELVLAMPLDLVFVSLFNAMAHAVEALYAPSVDVNVVSDAAAAVRELSTAIASLAERDTDDAREAALRGAHLAGRSLDAAQMGVHHKIAHVLGGTVGLSHSKAHTVLLPYSVSYNHAHAPIAMQQLATELRGDPVDVIVELQRRARVPASLDELGMSFDDIDRVVTLVMQASYPNPRPMEAGALRDLIAAAWRGDLRASGR